MQSLPSAPMPVDGYRLELALSSDYLEQIYKLRVAAWRSQADIKESHTEWRDEYDVVGHHWIILSGESVVGAIRLTLHDFVQDIPNYEVYAPVLPSPFPAPVASYNRMVVDPSHRGRGLSTKLDDICIREAKNLGAKALVGATGSVSGNRHRIATMERLGFLNMGEGAPYEADLFEAGKPTVMVLYL